MNPRPTLALRILFVLAACAGGVPLRAALEFEATTLSVQAEAGAETALAEFKFKNNGNQAVSIVRVASSCGCTVPEKPSTAIEPGATGSIPVLFKTAGRQGRQSQTVEVETSDGKHWSLRLNVDVPVRVSFSPRLLLFRGGDSAAKTATLTFAADPETRLESVSSQSPAFVITGEPRLEKGVLAVSIRHVGDAASEARASVRIRTRDSAGREHMDILYVRHAP